MSFLRELIFENSTLRIDLGSFSMAEPMRKPRVLSTRQSSDWQLMLVMFKRRATESVRRLQMECGTC